MSAQNPYAPPSAKVADVAPDDSESLESLNLVARGQRHVMFALLAQIVASGFMGVQPVVGGVLVLAAFLYGVIAVVRLASALGDSVVSRVLFCLGLLLPLLSLIVLAVLSARASKRLRAAGFKIGFLGAKPRES